ncbi:GAF domain-containing protein [Polaribacter litorisediminis]|uniref:ATP-binding protein n=1 Tax=Polaribacter litorisediminis TaxID=1908341 RepID=UPI001CBCB49B|nr:ATP-binding protein [Polaribacter litorisediminis]UAM97928.1 GAF domain-containing protein [Polaribacter litorisediminis]
MKFDKSILSQCDDETIHLLGKIQSHGFLLSFSKTTNRLNYASKNSRSFFGEELISPQKEIQDFFDEKVITYFESLKTQDFSNVLFSNEVTLNNRIFLLFFSNSGNYINIELEEQNEHHSKFQNFDKFKVISKNLKEYDSLDDLFSTTVDLLQDFTNFDRTMIYQFDKEGDGEVIAEKKTFKLDSFLGLKYPASDIPKQARRLYLTNLSRSIKSIDDEGIGIESLNNATNELDLSYAVYRSVSPVHLQYLKNMGVTATHAVSIIIDNKLWGMLIFHHYECENYLNFNTRFLLELITSNLANTIQLLELKELRNHEKLQKSLLDKIYYHNIDGDFSDIFVDNWLGISKQLQVCGVTVLHEHKPISNFGIYPADSEVLQLHELHKIKNSQEKLQFSDSLRSTIPTWKNKKIAGCACLTMSHDSGRYIYFWRASKEQIIHWAGNPDKVMSTKEINNTSILTPRASFALWVQKEKNKSNPWLASQKIFAKNLYEIIVQKEIKLYKNIFNQNSLLADSSRKLEMLLQQKSDELLRLNLQLKEELKENKEKQKELQIAVKASEEINILKAKILSNVSHEVRTPITSVIGMTRVLLHRDKLEESEKNFVNLILKSSNRLLDTVNKILVSTRLEKDDVELVLENIDLVNLTSEILTSLEIDARKKSQNLIFLAHNKSIMALIDKHFYTQIFTNLVSNAIKYAPNNGHIEINLKKALKKGENFVHLSIEDNGIGISEDAINKIFEPYYTEEKTTSQSDQSSGLGLFFVKSHITLLGGTIQTKSTKNIGTLFTVLLPTKI